jgi:formylglycine-generating enzyme required for sulfatase activity
MASGAAGKEVEGQPKAKVFISYSRKDMAFADRLEAALRARGFEPLIDREEIYAFEEWWKRIEALIARADTVVFVLSPDAVASDVALREVAFAASLNKRFAPVVCRKVDDKEVPEVLRRLNFIFFDEAEQLDKNADRLAEALNTDISWIRQHTEYGEAARRWSAASRPGGLLLQSPTLEVAEHWLISRPSGAPEPTTAIKEFVATSRKGARAALRLRRLVRASMFTLLVGIILGLTGWINQAYLKERIDWYWMIRPYRVANFDAYVLSADAERALKPGHHFRECAKQCPDMVVVPPGEFMMGSPETEKGREDDEGPEHKVVITVPFAVSKFEVTFNDWDACASVGACGQRGTGVYAGFGRGAQPVIYVSWDDAHQYVAWLSRMTGKSYRLLTEAEWEYAARAGTTGAYSWGDEIGTSNANCNGCGSQWDGKEPAPVGSFKANAFGLYDMHGNVGEWVEDCYHNSYAEASSGVVASLGRDCTYRVIRGGTWEDGPRFLRSAHRSGGTRVASDPSTGFRLGRTLAP